MTETIKQETPECLRSTEKCFERYQFGERYSDEVVRVSQIRKERNIVLRDLTDDIRANGLHNPVDVGVVSEAFMIEYLAFVHATWGDSAKLEDFADMRRENGMYTLLLAGHSRFQAIVDIQDEEFLQTGSYTFYPIPVKEHPIASIWDVIRIQLGENIHSTPPRERQAVALVEAYEYGLQQREWSDVDEFLSTREEDISRSFMVQALKFRRLTPELRSYVLSGPLNYSAGVELAMTVQPLRRLFAAKMRIKEKPTPEQAKEIDELVNIELMILANRIVENSMRITQAQTMIKGWRKKWNDEYEALTSDNADESMLVFDFVIEDFATRHNAARTNKLREQLRRLARLKSEDVARVISLARPGVGDEFVEMCLETQLSEAERIVALGKRARGAAQVLTAIEP